MRRMKEEDEEEGEEEYFQKGLCTIKAPKVIKS